ncbi:MAG: STAS domain-containing protein [Phycisphaerae bacterium]
MSTDPVNVRSIDEVCVVSFAPGVDLDDPTVEILRPKLLSAVTERAPRGLVLDVTNVPLASSRALGLFLTLRMKVHRAGAQAAIAGASPTLAHVFALTNLDKLYFVCATVEEALARIRAAT